MLKESNKRKFHKIIRIISAILIITFIAQDIVWAYPDRLALNNQSNNKLAATGLNNKNVVDRMKAAMGALTARKQSQTDQYYVDGAHIVETLQKLHEDFYKKYPSSATEVEVLFSMLPIDENSAYFAASLYGQVYEHADIKLIYPNGEFSGECAVRGSMKGDISDISESSYIKLKLPFLRGYKNIKKTGPDEFQDAINDMIKSAKILIRAGVPENKRFVLGDAGDIAELIRIRSPGIITARTLGDMANIGISNNAKKTGSLTLLRTLAGFLVKIKYFFRDMRRGFASDIDRSFKRVGHINVFSNKFNHMRYHFIAGSVARTFPTVELIKPLGSLYKTRSDETLPRKIAPENGSEYRKHLERVNKINEAIKIMFIRGSSERAEKYRTVTTILGLDMRRHLIFCDRKNKIYIGAHVGRTRNVLYIPLKLIDRLDPRDLATVLDDRQVWLDEYNRLVSSGASYDDMHKRLSFYLKEGKPDALDRAKEALRKCSDLDEYIMLKEIVPGLRKREKQLDRISKYIKSRIEAPDIPSSREKIGRALRLAEQWGVFSDLYAYAEDDSGRIRCFKKKIDALKAIQKYDTGMTPIFIQERIVLTYLREGMLEEGLKELSALLSGKDFLRRLHAGEEEIRKLVSSNYQTHQDMLYILTLYKTITTGSELKRINKAYEQTVRLFKIDDKSAKGWGWPKRAKWLPDLKKLAPEEIISIPKEDILAMIGLLKSIGIGNESYVNMMKERLLDSIFYKKTPECAKLKEIFLYMINLAQSQHDGKFKDIFIEALMSLPVKADVGYTFSSNLFIPSVTFALSEKLPIDSARYFDKDKSVAVIVYSKDFFNMDKYIGADNKDLEDAVRHVISERTLHELRHDNNIIDLYKEVLEEAEIIDTQDIPLWQITKSIGMQPKIDELRKDIRIKKSMHRSGDVFDNIARWAGMQNPILRKFAIQLYIYLTMFSLQPGKGFAGGKGNTISLGPKDKMLIEINKAIVSANRIGNVVDIELALLLAAHCDYVVAKGIAKEILIAKRRVESYDKRIAQQSGKYLVETTDVEEKKQVIDKIKKFLPYLMRELLNTWPLRYSSIIDEDFLSELDGMLKNRYIKPLETIILRETSTLDGTSSLGMKAREARNDLSDKVDEFIKAMKEKMTAVRRDDKSRMAVAVIQQPIPEQLYLEVLHEQSMADMARTAERIGDFLRNRRDLLGEREGDIAEAISEIIIGIIGHEAGGEVDIFFDKGKTEKDVILKIAAVDNAEGKYKGLDKPRKKKANIVKQEEGEEDQDPADAREEEFSKLAFIPDRASAETDGKKFIRIEKYTAAGALFKQEAASEVVAGAKLTLEFDLKAAWKLPRPPDRPESQASKTTVKAEETEQLPDNLREFMTKVILIAHESGLKRDYRVEFSLEHFFEKLNWSEIKLEKLEELIAHANKVFGRRGLEYRIRFDYDKNVVSIEAVPTKFSDITVERRISALREAQEDDSTGGCIGNFESIRVDSVRVIKEDESGGPDELEINVFVKKPGEKEERKALLKGWRAPSQEKKEFRYASRMINNPKVSVALTNALYRLTKDNPENIIVLDDNEFGINGIGALYKDMPFIAIHLSLFAKPMAKLHELGHLANAMGLLSSHDLIKLLPDQNKALEFSISKRAKHGYKSNAPESVKFHYAMRALQQQYRGVEDEEFTEAIKGIPKNKAWEYAEKAKSDIPIRIDEDVARVTDDIYNSIDNPELLSSGVKQLAKLIIYYEVKELRDRFGLKSAGFISGMEEFKMNLKDNILPALKVIRFIYGRDKAARMTMNISIDGLSEKQIKDMMDFYNYFLQVNSENEGEKITPAGAMILFRNFPSSFPIQLMAYEYFIKLYPDKTRRIKMVFWLGDGPVELIGPTIPEVRNIFIRENNKFIGSLNHEPLIKDVCQYAESELLRWDIVRLLVCHLFEINTEIYGMSERNMREESIKRKVRMMGERAFGSQHFQSDIAEDLLDTAGGPIAERALAGLEAYRDKFRDRGQDDLNESDAVKSIPNAGPAGMIRLGQSIILHLQKKGLSGLKIRIAAGILGIVEELLFIGVFMILPAFAVVHIFNLPPQVAFLAFSGLSGLLFWVLHFKEVAKYDYEKGIFETGPPDEADMLILGSLGVILRAGFMNLIIFLPLSYALIAVVSLHGIFNLFIAPKLEIGLALVGNKDAKLKTAKVPDIIEERRRTLEEIVRVTDGKARIYGSQLKERFSDLSIDTQQRVRDLFKLARDEEEKVGGKKRRGISHLKALLAGVKPGWFDYRNTVGDEKLKPFISDEVLMKFLGLDYILVDKAPNCGPMLYNVELVREVFKSREVRGYLEELLKADLENLLKEKDTRHDVRVIIDAMLQKDPRFIGIVLGIPLEDVKTYIRQVRYDKMVDVVDVSGYAVTTNSPVDIVRPADLENIGTGLRVDVITKTGKKYGFFKKPFDIPSEAKLSKYSDNKFKVELFGYRYSPKKGWCGVLIGMSSSMSANEATDFKVSRIYDQAEDGLKAYIAIAEGAKYFDRIYGPSISENNIDAAQPLEIYPPNDYGPEAYISKGFTKLDGNYNGNILTPSPDTDNRAENEDPFIFDKYARTHIPVMEGLTDDEIEAMKGYISKIFRKVNDDEVKTLMLDHKIIVGSIINKERILFKDLSKGLLPTAKCYKDGSVEINENFVKLMAYLARRGWAGVNIEDEEYGLIFNLLDSIIYSVALHEIRGHYSVDMNGSVSFDKDESMAQLERGYKYNHINTAVMLFYWLSLCENRDHRDLRERVREFLNKECPSITGETQGSLLGLIGPRSRVNCINMIVKIAKNVYRIRPERYVENSAKVNLSEPAKELITALTEQFPGYKFSDKRNVAKLLNMHKHAGENGTLMLLGKYLFKFLMLDYLSSKYPDADFLSAHNFIDKCQSTEERARILKDRSAIKDQKTLYARYTDFVIDKLKDNVYSGENLASGLLGALVADSRDPSIAAVAGRAFMERYFSRFDAPAKVSPEVHSGKYNYLSGKYNVHRKAIKELLSRHIPHDRSVEEIVNTQLDIAGTEGARVFLEPGVKEALGDAILDYVVTDELWSQFEFNRSCKSLDELRYKTVNGRFLAQVMMNILEPGKKKLSISEIKYGQNLFEALVAVVYKNNGGIESSGLSAARDFIFSMFKDYLSTSSDIDLKIFPYLNNVKLDKPALRSGNGQPPQGINMVGHTETLSVYIDRLRESISGKKYHAGLNAIMDALKAVSKEDEIDRSAVTFDPFMNNLKDFVTAVYPSRAGPGYKQFYALLLSKDIDELKTNSTSILTALDRQRNDICKYISMPSANTSLPNAGEVAGKGLYLGDLFKPGTVLYIFPDTENKERFFIYTKEQFKKFAKQAMGEAVSEISPDEPDKLSNFEAALYGLASWITVRSDGKVFLPQKIIKRIGWKRKELKQTRFDNRIEVTASQKSAPETASKESGAIPESAAPQEKASSSPVAEDTEPQIKLPDEPDVAGLSPLEKLNAYNNYCKGLGAIVKDIDLTCKIYYGAHGITWEDWSLHSISSIQHQLFIELLLIRRHEAQQKSIKKMRNKIKEIIFYLNILKAMADADINKYLSKLTKAGTESDPVEYQELGLYFMKRLFVEHKNAKTNFVIFKESVKRMDSALQKIKIFIDELAKDVSTVNGSDSKTPSNLYAYHSTTLDALPLVIDYGVWAPVGKGVVITEEHIKRTGEEKYVSKENAALILLVYKMHKDDVYQRDSWEAAIKNPASDEPDEEFLNELRDLDIPEDESSLYKFLLNVKRHTPYAKAGHIDKSLLDVEKTIEENRHLVEAGKLSKYALEYLEFLLKGKNSNVLIYKDFNKSDTENISFSNIRQMIRSGEVIVFRGGFYLFPKSSDSNVSEALAALRKHIQRHSDIYVDNGNKVIALSNPEATVPDDIQEFINLIKAGKIKIDNTVSYSDNSLKQFITYTNEGGAIPGSAILQEKAPPEDRPRGVGAAYYDDAAFSEKGWNVPGEAMDGNQTREALKGLPPSPAADRTSSEAAEALVFNKKGKALIVPFAVRKQLSEMACLARKLNVELDATLYVRDGTIVRAEYPTDETKLVIIKARSKDEYEVTEKIDYFVNPLRTIFCLKLLFEEMAELQNVPDKKDRLREVVAELQNNASELTDCLKESSISIFSVKTGRRYELDELKLRDSKQLEADFANIEYAVTPWIGPENLSTKRETYTHDEKLERIYVHNHPNGNPSPPSAVDEKMLLGDIYSPRFFSGEVSAVILDTQEGDEIFFLYEPGEANKLRYAQIYNLYWYKTGDPVVSKEPAAAWLPEAQTYGRSCNEKEVLTALRELALGSFVVNPITTTVKSSAQENIILQKNNSPLPPVETAQNGLLPEVPATITNIDTPGLLIHSTLHVFDREKNESRLAAILKEGLKPRNELVKNLRGPYIGVSPDFVSLAMISKYHGHEGSDASPLHYFGPRQAEKALVLIINPAFVQANSSQFIAIGSDFTDKSDKEGFLDNDGKIFNGIRYAGEDEKRIVYISSLSNLEPYSDEVWVKFIPPEAIAAIIASDKYAQEVHDIIVREFPARSIRIFNPKGKLLFDIISTAPRTLEPGMETQLASPSLAAEETNRVAPNGPSLETPGSAISEFWPDAEKTVSLRGRLHSAANILLENNREDNKLTRLGFTRFILGVALILGALMVNKSFPMASGLTIGCITIASLRGILVDTIAEDGWKPSGWKYDTFRRRKLSNDIFGSGIIGALIVVIKEFGTDNIAALLPDSDYINMVLDISILSLVGGLATYFARMARRYPQSTATLDMMRSFAMSILAYAFFATAFYGVHVTESFIPSAAGFLVARKLIGEILGFCIELPVMKRWALEKKIVSKRDDQEPISAHGTKIASTEKIKTASGVRIYKSGMLTEEQLDDLARFLVKEGVAISTKYMDDEAHAVEIGRAYLEKLKASDKGKGEFFVAFINEEPVGIISCTILSPTLKREMEYEATIDDVHVAKDKKRNGIGRILLEKIQEYLKSEDIGNYLVCVGQGEDAQNFWKKVTPLKYQTYKDGMLANCLVSLKEGVDLKTSPNIIGSSKQGPTIQRGPDAGEIVSGGGIVPNGPSMESTASRRVIQALFDLEKDLNCLNDDRRLGTAMAVVIFYQALMAKGKEIPLSFLKNNLNDSNWAVRFIAVRVLGLKYQGLTPEEKKVVLSLLEDKLYDCGNVCKAAAQALDMAYEVLIKQGEEPSLYRMENKLSNCHTTDVPWVLARVLGRAYQNLVKAGKMSLPSMKNKIDNLRKRSFAALCELNSAYEALIKKEEDEGEKTSLSFLEKELEDIDRYYRIDYYYREIVTYVLKPAYQFLTGEVEILDEDYAKYRLWTESNLPYQETLVKQYFVAPDAQGFILSSRHKAENAVNNGFDYSNEEELWFAYLGLRINGINITYDEFKQRMKKLAQFDREHPGYFKQLFTKAKSIRIIELSSQGARSIDASNVDLEILRRNLDELFKTCQRIDSLTWMDEDFPKSKIFNLLNIYYLFKREEAQAQSTVKEGERFKCEFPSEEAMKQELLANRKSFYKIVFSLAKDRLGDGLIGNKCLLLMRDLIISDIMLEEGLLREMRSTDSETMIAAFKNFYGDYKNHLPNSVGLSVGKIKGLGKCFEDFSSAVYAEISKVKIVKRIGDLEPYRLVERGFLSVFRGRAGIIDCSFDVNDKGDAYTRAMHEDTLYLFVYKGKELKGYIGLMIAQDSDKRKVLTIDTINSPSLDGEELLGNLFKALNDLAKELGCSGIALPKDIGPSFNFDNEDTIPKMTIYRRAKPVSVTPLHQTSWNYFTRMFGEDEYNSIEEGKFRLLDIKNSSSRQPSETPPSSAGGINMVGHTETLSVYIDRLRESISGKKYHAGLNAIMDALRAVSKEDEIDRSAVTFDPFMNNLKDFVTAVYPSRAGPGYKQFYALLLSKDIDELKTNSASILTALDHHGSNIRKYISMLSHDKSSGISDAGLFFKLLRDRLEDARLSGLSVEILNKSLNEDCAELFESLKAFKRSLFGSEEPRSDFPQEEMCELASSNFCNAFKEVFKGHFISLIPGKYICKDTNVVIDHRWALIDGEIIVDITYGQFDEKYRNKVLVTTRDRLGEFSLEEDPVPLTTRLPSKSASSSLLNADVAMPSEPSSEISWPSEITEDLRRISKFRHRDFSYDRLVAKVKGLFAYNGPSSGIIHKAVYNGIRGMAAAVLDGEQGMSTVLGLAGEISGLYQVVIRKPNPRDALGKISLGKIDDINKLVKDGRGTVKEFDAVSKETVYEFKFHLTLSKLYQQVIGIDSAQMPHLRILIEHPEYSGIRNIVYFGESDGGHVVEAIKEFVKKNPQVLPQLNLNDPKELVFTLSLSQVKDFLLNKSTIGLAYAERHSSKARHYLKHFKRHPKYMKKLISKKILQLKGREPFNVIIVVNNCDISAIRKAVVPEVQAMPRSSSPAAENIQSYEISPDVDWSTAFEDTSKPIMVEVGFGRGDELLKMARNNPASNYIGIEKDEENIQELLTRLTQEKIPLMNLKIIHAYDFKAFMNQSKSDIISDIYYVMVNQRELTALVREEWFGNMTRLVKPGGKVYISTDVAKEVNPDYTGKALGSEYLNEQTLALFKQAGFSDVTDKSELPHMSDSYKDLEAIKCVFQKPLSTVQDADLKTSPNAIGPSKPDLNLSLDKDDTFDGILPNESSPETQPPETPALLNNVPMFDSFETLIRNHFAGQNSICGFDLGAASGIDTVKIQELLQANFNRSDFIGLEKMPGKVKIAQEKGRPVIEEDFTIFVDRDMPNGRDLITALAPPPQQLSWFISSAKRLVSKNGLIVIYLSSFDMEDLIEGRQVFYSVEPAAVWRALSDFTLIKFKDRKGLPRYKTEWGDFAFVYSPKGINIASISAKTEELTVLPDEPDVAGLSPFEKFKADCEYSRDMLGIIIGIDPTCAINNITWDDYSDHSTINLIQHLFGSASETYEDPQKAIKETRYHMDKILSNFAILKQMADTDINKYLPQLTKAGTVSDPVKYQELGLYFMKKLFVEHKDAKTNFVIFKESVKRMDSALQKMKIFIDELAKDEIATEKMGQSQSARSSRGGTVPIFYRSDEVGDLFAASILLGQVVADVITPKQEIIPDSVKGKALVLYADDVLERGTAADLAHTLKETAIMNNSTIVLYERLPGRAKILEDIINTYAIGKEIKVIKIIPDDIKGLNGGSDINVNVELINEAKELELLLRHMSSRYHISNGSLLGVIKGRTNGSYIDSIKEVAKEKHAPVILFEHTEQKDMEKEIYSFKEALSLLINILNDPTPLKDKEWFRFLKPIEREDIEKAYQEYRRALDIVINA